MIIILISDIINTIFSISITRSYAALRAADLDWIIGPGYSSGGYILEPLLPTHCFQTLIPQVMMLNFKLTRSCAALRAADLDWIVGPGYSWGGYILGGSQRLASCLQHSARIGPDLLCHRSSVTHRGVPTDWR